jgi:hypothetical protein
MNQFQQFLVSLSMFDMHLQNSLSDGSLNDGFLSDRSSNSSRVQLLNTLQDIAQNVQIESNYCVSHPRYGKAELAPERLEQFQQLPTMLQNRYLSLQVRNFLHDIYFTGIHQPGSEITALADDKPSQIDAENNMAWGLNLDFYAKLHDSNCGKGFFDPGWRVEQDADGLLAVQKQGLTLHIERDCHLRSSEQSAAIGEMVAIKMPRNRLETGWYIAVGDAGLLVEGNSLQVDVYFNLCHEGAASMMQSLTQQLNELQIPFTFKVPYNPLDYERYDSGVLSCEKSHYKIIQPALQNVYVANISSYREETPLFTKCLAPGIAVAEVPSQKFSAQEDFGLNRCQILANGLLAAYQQGEHSSEIKMVMILNQIYEHGVDLNFPHLDNDSEDK